MGNILELNDLDALSDSAKDNLLNDWDFSRQYLSKLINTLSSQDIPKRKKDKFSSALSWISNKTYFIILAATAVVCILYLLGLFFLK